MKKGRMKTTSGKLWNDSGCSVNVRRISVDQFRAQLIHKALYEFHVEFNWFSIDLIDPSVL